MRVVYWAVKALSGLDDDVSQEILFHPVDFQNPRFKKIHCRTLTVKRNNNEVWGEFAQCLYIVKLIRLMENNMSFF